MLNADRKTLGYPLFYKQMQTGTKFFQKSVVITTDRIPGE